MSPKIPELVHRNRAGEDAIRRWQRNAKRQISRLQRQGFTTVILGESIFVDSPTVGRKYWSCVGEPVTVPYMGSRRRTVATGGHLHRRTVVLLDVRQLRWPDARRIPQGSL